MKYFIALVLVIALVGVVSADTYVIPEANDAHMTQTTAGSTWETLRTASGSTGADAPTGPFLIYTGTHATTNDLFLRIYRYGAVFNGSVLAGGTVTSAKLRIKIYAKATTLGGTNEAAVVVGSPGNPMDFAAGDYDGLTLSTASEIAPRVDFSELAAGKDVNFTFSGAGLATVFTNNTLFTYYVLDGDELDGTWSGTGTAGLSRILRAYGISDATEGNRPYLEVESTPAAGGDPPVANFTKNQTAGVAPLPVGFTDTSTNTPDEWHWWINNVTGNNTPYEFSTDQNPSITLGVGNWSFALNASNAYGWNITPGYDWVNVSGIEPTPTPTPTPTQAQDAGFDGYAHFNFTAWNDTPMSDWNWSVDNIYVGNNTDPFLNIWLLWGQIHNVTLFISNETDNRTISQFYNLHNITPTITPTQTAWIPDINPSTEVNYAPENLFNYWWIPTLILVIWLLFRRS